MVEGVELCSIKDILVEFSERFHNREQNNQVHSRDQF